MVQNTHFPIQLLTFHTHSLHWSMNFLMPLVKNVFGCTQRCDVRCPEQSSSVLLCLPLWNLSTPWYAFLFITGEFSPYCANIHVRVLFPLVTKIKWQDVSQQWCNSTKEPSGLQLIDNMPGLGSLHMMYMSAVWIGCYIQISQKFQLPLIFCNNITF